ncbi:hypothetical protein POM88_010727 [Heracleum sosnowskyi]|uniref:Uncharacterized protein n=1 Tax=Heracleum sosnowskyi TaxID=360622 RepID=A0AAD8IU61_9APIA|nr:hypothetical protein POM88_010727 [Heracleum sosnowskyi]
MGYSTSNQVSRQGNNSTSHPQSSISSVKGSKEKLDHESSEERDDTDEDDKKAIKRRRYSLRENTRKAKKVKRETLSYKKTRRNKCKRMIAGSSIIRWSAERDMEDTVSNFKEEMQKVRREKSS